MSAQSSKTPTELSNVPECGHKLFATIEHGKDPNNPGRVWVFLKDYFADERYFYKSYPDYATAHAKATRRISFCLKCKTTWVSSLWR